MKLTLKGKTKYNKAEFKRIVSISNEDKRRNQFLSNQKDKNTIEQCRQILKGYRYNPIILCLESLHNDCKWI